MDINNAVGKFILYKPIKIDGKEIKELEYDFDELPSNAIPKAYKFLAQQKYMVASPQGDPMFNLMMFASAAKIDYADAMRMHPKDQIEAASISQVFFMSGSEDTSIQMTSEE